MKIREKYTDAELTAAISQQTELNRALQYLYQQYADTTCSFIIHYGGSQQDAEDIFQETVISFVGIVKRGSFRGDASIRTFLVSVARNLWFNEQKKRERAGNREKKFEYGREQNDVDISEHISSIEKKRELRELVYKLGDSCRKVLMLFYYENLSMKEIVGLLPYENEQVVRNKKYKCLQQLTGMIKDNPAIAGQIREIMK